MLTLYFAFLPSCCFISDSLVLILPVDALEVEEEAEAEVTLTRPAPVADALITAAEGLAAAAANGEPDLVEFKDDAAARR